jgi:competence protein ComEC
VRREPLLLPALAAAFGVFLAHFFYWTWSDLFWPGCFGLLAIGLSFLEKGARLQLASALAVFFLAGIAFEIAHRPPKPPVLNAADGETVLLDGCVVNPPVFSPGREQLTLQMGRRARVRLSVVTPEDSSVKLPYGSRIEVAARIRRPRNFNNPGAFDMAGYLAKQSVFWTGSVADPSQVHRLTGSCGEPLLGPLFAIRTWALERLAEAYPSDTHTRGLLAATLLGETSGVERQWTDEFRSTGTYHAVVISGLHVWIVTASLFLLLHWCQVPKLKCLFVCAVASWVYAFVAGGNAPVVRAAAGYSLFCLASFLFRRTRLLNLVSGIAIVFLACDPEALFDAAFQLSFLAAAAIACFAIPLIERYVEPLKAAVKRFEQTRYDALVEWRAATWRVEFRLLAETISAWTGLTLSRSRRLVAWGVLGFVFVSEAALLSACVQFALALPMICYFHRLSLTGLTANVVVVPLLTLVIPTGFATIFTGWQFLAGLTAGLLHLSEATAVWHLQFEPNWRMGAIPLGLALSFSLALVLLALVIRHRRKFVPAAFVVSFILFATICLQPWRQEVQGGKLEVTAIDVGQGDSIFVGFPNGETMLIDAGGVPGLERMKRKPRLDLGEDVVSPYLWQRRIRHLDYVAVTHGHSDHMAGMPAVLDNFRPPELLTGAEPSTHEWAGLAQRAVADHTRILHLHRGEGDRTIGGVKMHVLAPAPDYAPGEQASNNDSLVVELTYGKHKVLLTGDAERPVEDELLQSGSLRNVTLLKVGHHGSRTSSSEDFLAQVAPRVAFISDGYMNQFHHPHPQVLKRLVDHHAAVFRTDVDGMLTFVTDGDRYSVSVYR